MQKNLTPKWYEILLGHPLLMFLKSFGNITSFVPSKEPTVWHLGTVIVAPELASLEVSEVVEMHQVIRSGLQQWPCSPHSVTCAALSLFLPLRGQEDIIQDPAAHPTDRTCRVTPSRVPLSRGSISAAPPGCPSPAQNIALPGHFDMWGKESPVPGRIACCFLQLVISHKIRKFSISEGREQHFLFLGVCPSVSWGLSIPVALSLRRVHW